MKMKKIFMLTMLFSLLCISCSKKNDNIINPIIYIYIDFNKIVSYDVNNGKFINLEFTDSSMITNIDNIEILNNSNILLTTKNLGIIFDENGKYLSNVGTRGNSPEEYVNLNSMYTNNDFISILDIMTRRVLNHDLMGKYKNTASIKASAKGYLPSALYKLKEGYYISNNTFQGDVNKTPTCSILDSSYNFVNAIKGRNLSDGITSYDNFYQFENEILYWELFNDTIFAIQQFKTISGKYFIDFNEHALKKSERKGKDRYDLIQYSNNKDVVNRLATMIKNVYEDKNYLRFMYVMNKNIYYVKYNKRTKDVRTFKLEDRKGQFKLNPFVKYEKGHIYISASSTEAAENNPYLIIINDTFMN